MMESIIYAAGVAIFGGFLGAVKGSYSATKNGETFDKTKFLNFIPKSCVGAVMALGAAVVGNQITSLDVTNPMVFFSILAIGFATTLGLPSMGGSGNKNPPAVTEKAESVEVPVEVSVPAPAPVVKEGQPISTT